MPSTQRKIDLHDEWLTHLQTEFDKGYMRQLADFLRAEKAAGKVLYPASRNIFSALNVTPLSSVSVVVLGQDPYHGPNQAQGLSFSVPQGERVPPSLKNIYQEIASDTGCRIPSHGNLMHWANQGVLLLNSVLTVLHGQAGSHQGKGWERFTDKVVETINRERQNVAFLLWGSYAQKKGHAIDRRRHLVLHAPHPSPLSAHRGFLGCGHFSQVNDYLQSTGRPKIDWQIV